jgi:hypothetical protein
VIEGLSVVALKSPLKARRFGGLEEDGVYLFCRFWGFDEEKKTALKSKKGI